MERVRHTKLAHLCRRCMLLTNKDGKRQREDVAMASRDLYATQRHFDKLSKAG